jgi:hypothetical protein
MQLATLQIRAHVTAWQIAATAVPQEMVDCPIGGGDGDGRGRLARKCSGVLTPELIPVIDIDIGYLERLLPGFVTVRRE